MRPLMCVGVCEWGGVGVGRQFKRAERLIEFCGEPCYSRRVGVACCVVLDLGVLTTPGEAGHSRGPDWRRAGWAGEAMLGQDWGGGGGGGSERGVGGGGG